MAKTKGADAAPSLDAIRMRIDSIDAELLRLIDERSSLARAVAAAKAASGAPGGFGLRPGREAEVIRRLLAMPRDGARPELVVRIWRELIGESLGIQGPFHLSVWGGREPARIVELARMRFGSAPALAQAARPEDALAAAKTPGGVAVIALAPDSAWWGRLLAEPSLRIFAVHLAPEMSAVAVADVPVEPTGDDLTFWVTDAPEPAAAVEEALSRDGVAATLLLQAGGLKLFTLAGFYQPQDERLARAPGRLSGVIGAAPSPLPV